MAYAALVSLSQTIQNILSHDDQSSDFFRKKQQIRSLHDHVVFLQSFLEEFTDKLADNLEGRIRDIANEAEDIFEYLILNQIQSFHSHRRREEIGHVKCFSFISEQIRSFYSHRGGAGLGNVQNPDHEYDTKKLYKKLQMVTQETDSIVGEVMAIKNSLRSGDVELISDSPTASSLSRQARRASTNKDSMVGFDEYLMAIKARLCGESSKFQVIPIFGMGGIGKTTLARNAYDDPLTVEHFHVRAWVTVSQDYSITRILSQIQVSLKAFNEERFDQSDETMATSVYKSLKGRRYLVVMDDMWSTNAWDDVRRLFPDDNNGSRIILTTRLSDVAAYADCSNRLHEMHFMDIDQSWNLLSQKVFKQEQCPHELEDIGRTIARSCRGLPLAIVVIAGILSKVSQTRASWENVAENVTLAVSTNEEQFANVLSLSYTHLPYHLRSCFLYMGGFTGNYEIHVSKLIKLWTAEGFIKPSGSKSYEESAEEYLEDLVKRSLVLVTKRKPDGRIKSCNVHDLVRDLCIRKAQEEKFLGSGLLRQRRICMHNWVPLSELGYYDSAIHSILRFPICQEALYCLKKFRLLRVLDATEFEIISEFPSEVLELIFLRYIAFSSMPAFDFGIPASISILRNLETLNHLSTYE
ncbi:hypothetical protein BUALT_Bualt06G0006600 [Buddleja alternifolia]|uniref:Uncharacterized protein n=1 Tax=Buddleja alternifolia TaxID=168488 RepID=A0AAV6XIC9_9LAMI|nr:hypothetical protein BUALT_Bualt06G0006600 [Buddleja alternifolia]